MTISKRKLSVDDFSASCSSLEEVILRANEIIEKYPEITYKDFEFTVCDDYGNEYVRVEYSRPETDEEYELRLTREAREKLSRDASRRMQYEKLKKEFEPE
jgi:hypothetical protein